MPKVDFSSPAIRLITVKSVRARQAHQCFNCNRRINKYEQYSHVFYKAHDRLRKHKTCEECTPVYVSKRKGSQN